MSQFSSVQPPEVYEVNGIKFMRILGIVITLPPPESEVYKEYLKCNNFAYFENHAPKRLKDRKTQVIRSKTLTFTTPIVLPSVEHESPIRKKPSKDGN
ncbi:unnamed protein product [Rhizophagus irregularis]|nr:unnamed protein product [Rhizophagus irregularis]